MDNQLSPEKVLTPEKFLEYEKILMGNERMDYIMKYIDKDGIKIIDIGGASGYFLEEIIKKSPFYIDATNLDVDGFFSTKQVNKCIKFLCKSILDSGIDDETYDIITFRHILHHLVAENISDTLENQQNALNEMMRILKKDGYLIFEEEVNNIKLFSRIIYLLSKFANKLKINVKFFEAGKVVVSFLTQKEMKRILSRAGENTEVL
jgi:SAM-dependent methyltransferase